MDGGTALAPPVELAQSAATLSLTSLPSLGNNAITAVYNGSDQFTTSTSAESDVYANLGAINVSTGGDANSADGSLSISNSLTFSDPNPGASAWSVSISYGDCDTGGPACYTPYPGYYPSAISYQYWRAGNYTVTVNITDDLGATGSTTFNASVC
jgi:hypothetical protein